MSLNEDELAKERDEKFKRWLQAKTLRDKALDYLKKLDPVRAESEDSLKAVGVCLLAVDRLMGNDDAGGGDDGDENEADNKDVSDMVLLASAAIINSGNNDSNNQYFTFPITIYTLSDHLFHLMQKSPCN